MYYYNNKLEIQVPDLIMNGFDTTVHVSFTGRQKVEFYEDTYIGVALIIEDYYGNLKELMKMNSSMTIAYYNLNLRKNTSYTVSLNGFTKACKEAGI